MCENNFPSVAAAAGIRTRDLLITCPASIMKYMTVVFIARHSLTFLSVHSSVTFWYCVYTNKYIEALYIIRMCGKPKFGSDSVFKKPNRHRTVQKFGIRSDCFSTETACKFAIYVKSDKKLLYLHSNVHKKLFKHYRNRN